MTQALNLANFANNLNTAGATSNTGLQNSSVTVTAGTGMSGGGAVALGSSVTLNNAGVTSIVAGTGISISGATGAVTVTSTVTGGVTSAVAGNGVAVSASTGAVTFSASCPTAISVGSYTALDTTGGTSYSTGSNYSGRNYFSSINIYNQPQLSSVPGTWKMMGMTAPNTGACGFSALLLACRVS